MMTKILVLLSAVLFFLGCAGNTLTAGTDRGGSAGEMSVSMPAHSNSESAKGLDVDVVQTAAPPVLGGVTTVDVQYTFEVKNKSEVPTTVRRITIWNAGGGKFQVENRSRTFNKTIEPGATEKIPFWTRANGVSEITGSNPPVTLRVELEVEGPEGTRKAQFMRTVNGSFSIGATRDQ